ncbi:hypothetical protein LTR53_015965 [Teratosphaeriaceae sp. CCFEE 6253]|nr:hypothetical protein LTR53_015965 [Teratosphaeriaceae sp. CCFEE 6253]
MSEDASALRSRIELISTGAYLDVLLPKSSDFDASAFIRDGSPEELARAPSRRTLFFDEKTGITLILRTAADAAKVRDILPSLEIVLAAHVTDAVQQGTASASGKKDLSTKTFPAADGAEVVVGGDQTYVIWRLALDRARPMTRLQKPAIYFTANLSIHDPPSTAADRLENDYLTPFQPLSRNVLDSLNVAPDFKDKEVYLPEDRLTKVTPKPVRKEDTVRPIRGATKRAFPTMPALYTRIRYDAMQDTIIASLHLEASQAIKGQVSVEEVTFKLPVLQSAAEDPVVEDEARRGVARSDAAKARVQCLTEPLLPLKLSAGDESVLLYSLPRGADSAGSNALLRIRATAELEEEGAPVGLDISWQSLIEPPQPKAQPVHAWSPPSIASLDKRTPGQPAAYSASASAPPKPQNGGDGVTFFFTAPATTSKYDDFLLSIKCINRSTKTRSFVVLPIQKKPSARAGEPSFPAGTFCHTPRVRISSVPPGADYDTAMELRAMGTGVLRLGTLRIEDQETRQTVDVVDLPDIVAFEAHEGSRAHGPSKFAVQMTSLVSSKRKDSMRKTAAQDADEMYWGKAATPSFV